jgi:transcription termination factor Rho
MEVHLERRLAEKRVYPSINLNKSGTRREELLIKPEVLQKIWVLRKFIHDMDEVERWNSCSTRSARRRAIPSSST